MKACDGLSLFLLFLHLLPLLQASAIPNADEQEKSLQRLLQATLPPSSSSSSFNLSSPLCSWTRMIRCSSDGAVTGLFLERLGLRGIMPNNTFSFLSLNSVYTVTLYRVLFLQSYGTLNIYSMCLSLLIYLKKK